MGIVINQSIKNTIITYIGFGIGAINTLFLYTNFLDDHHFGLVMYILSTANILMPLMAFGTNNTLIKFYSSFKTRQSQDSFLTLMLILPLLVIIPLGGFFYWGYTIISDWLSAKNAIIKNYTWLIFITAVAFAYFELFYAWARVQLQSVFGNFLKEVFHRVCIAVLLLLLYLEFLNVNQFIYSITGVYILRMLIMKFYAYSLKLPILCIKKPPQMGTILKYSGLMIVAGSVSYIVLEIDKFMLGQFITIKYIAYYGVAVFTASVIGVPLRSMQQIVTPITAQLLNTNNKTELRILYKKTALNLVIVSGLLFLLITLNISELYKLLDPAYSQGFVVVLCISIATLIEAFLGNNNAILFNSNYYRMVLVLGVFLVLLMIVLNLVLIPNYGINGAAFATAIAMIIYNSSKIAFVYNVFKIHPFSYNLLKTTGLILSLFLVFYFWNFPWHPILNITLKSLLIIGFYGLVVYKANFSSEITTLWNRIFKKKIL